MTISLSNSKLSVQINSKGAELISLINKVTTKNFIWDGNPIFWGRHAPVLFPIVGTLKDDCYTYNNVKYSLSRHGFARDSEFDIIYHNSNEVKFTLPFSKKSLNVYPFKFELQITYTLINFTLKIEYEVFNLDSDSIPFSIGAHPAFSLTKGFENYSLEFESQETLKCFTLQNDLLSNKTYNIELNNKKLPLSYSIFENDALIFKTLQSKSITILERVTPKVKIEFKDFINLGIWTKPNAPFICIEPWLGFSDTLLATGNLIEKEGIQILPENKTFKSHYSIEII